MSLTLQDLQDIQAICRAGSFRQAARQLGITQPTLSNRVGRMETGLGAPLFERSQGRSVPAALALMIADRAADLLGDAERLVREVDRISRSESGTVRIGVGPAPAAALLHRLIPRVKAELPQISLVCRFGEVSKLLQQLESGDTDFVACSHDPELARPMFESTPIIADRIVIGTHPDHPLAKNPPSSMPEIFNFRVAMPVLEPMYQHRAQEIFKTDLGRIPGVAYCSNFAILEELAIAEDYVVIGPGLGFRGSIEAGKLVTMPIPGGITHEGSLHTNRAAIPIPAVESVLAIFLDEAECLNQELNS